MACAAHLLGDEPFIFVYSDVLTVAKPSTFKKLMKKYEELNGSILTCMKVESEKEFGRYGILAGEELGDGIIKMSGVIEKPGIEKAPSNFASVSSFLFAPDILKYIDRGLANLKPGQEFYITDSLIEPMIRDGYDFYGYQVKNSRRYDTGDVLEYLKTVFDFALHDKEIGPELWEYLREMYRAEQAKETVK